MEPAIGPHDVTKADSAAQGGLRAVFKKGSCKKITVVRQIMGINGRNAIPQLGKHVETEGPRGTEPPSKPDFCRTTVILLHRSPPAAALTRD